MVWAYRSGQTTSAQAIPFELKYTSLCEFRRISKEIREMLYARVLKDQREGALEIERGWVFRLGEGLAERQSRVW